MSSEGQLNIEMDVPAWADIAKRNNLTRPGGEWSPLDCGNTEKLAIIIPYRDRDEHLRIFLNHMHPILQRQQLSYRIFVVEQVRIIAIITKVVVMSMVWHVLFIFQGQYNKYNIK